MAIQQKTLSDRTVSALRTANDTVNWDRDLPGFGVRVYPSWSRVCIVQTRAKGKSKHVTVGRHGVIAAEQARQRAAQIITRVKAGKVPVPAPMAPKPPTGPTVAELAARYLREHVAVRCKPGTVAQRQFVLRKHILPALGAKPLAVVTREDVAALHYKMRGTPATANAAVATLSRMFAFAETCGLAPEGGNPCRFVVKYSERRRERFLLGRTLVNVRLTLTWIAGESPAGGKV